MHYQLQIHLFFSLDMQKYNPLNNYLLLSFDSYNLGTVPLINYTII